MEFHEPVNESLLKITSYELLGKLPDPFVTDSGKRIASQEEWDTRRAEIYRSAVELQYGTLPPKPEFLESELLYTSVATKTKPSVTRVYHVRTGTKACPVTFRMMVLYPPADKYEGTFPVIISGDQCWRYHMDREYLSAALDEGVGWVFFDRTELAHDLQNEGRRQGALYRAYPEYGFGAVGAWAWGYSRCVDALEKTDVPFDRDWIIFTGHSRGAKTAALAGAVDERARIVNPNATCAGACGCYRIHMKAIYAEKPEVEKASETLRDLWDRFSFWIGEGMEAYCDREQDLPFDAHYLKALVAPRTLLISEGAGDLWANPVGSWQTTMAAKEVFRFLGAEDNLFWYFRPGGHAQTPHDIRMLVNVLKHQKDGVPVDERMFRLPFVPPEMAFDWKSPLA